MYSRIELFFLSKIAHAQTRHSLKKFLWAMDRLGELLKDPALAEKALAAYSPQQARVFSALVLQSVFILVERSDAVKSGFG